MKNITTGGVQGAQCNSVSTEYVIQKPCAGSNVSVELSQNEPSALNFSVADIKAMQVLPAGALLLTFFDGSTLTIQNFDAARTAGKFTDLNMADGTTINLNKVYQGLASSVQQAEQTLSIDKPNGLAGTALSFNLENGKTYDIGFDPKTVANVKPQANGDLIVSFIDGTVLTLHNFSKASTGNDQAELSLPNGETILASNFVQNISTLDRQTEIAKVEPAAGEETKHVVKHAPQKQAKDVADIEPAAGESAKALNAVQPAAGEAAGPLQNSGAGFGSNFAAGGLNPANAIGPIAPTALAFGTPEPTLDARDAIPLGGPAPVPTTPVLGIADTFTYEDTEIDLNILAGAANPATQTAVVVVTGIPAGWTLISGGGALTTNPDGSQTWTKNLGIGETLTGGPTLKPPAESDADALNLRVTVTQKEVSTGATETSTDTFSVFVDAVADQPTIGATNVRGPEDTVLNLNITTQLTDRDGSETYTGGLLRSVPTGFTITGAGATKNADGTWSFDPTRIAELKITPPNGFSGTFPITVEVFNKETNLSGTEITTANNTNGNSYTFTVTYDPVVDMPSLSVTDALIKEDSTAANNAAISGKRVNIQASLNDTDGSEQLTVTVANVPAGITPVFPAGEAWVKDASGTWVLALPVGTTSYNGYIALPSQATNSDADYNNIVVKAYAQETATSEKAINTKTATVIVDAVADGVNINLTGTNTQAGTPLPLNLTLGLKDTDGSEILQSTVTLKGIPSGYTLTAGTKQANGDWVVNTSDIAGLKLVTPSTASGSFTLTVIAGSHETATGVTEPDLTDNDATNSAQYTINITSVPFNPPVVDIDIIPGTDGANAYVYEDTTATNNALNSYSRVNFTADLDKTDGSEQLTVKVTIPAGFTPVFPAGEAWVQSGNVWTLTLPAGQNYSGYVALGSGAANADIDINGIKIDATSTQVSTGRTLSDSDTAKVVVDAVADKPTLDAQDVTANEGSTAVALKITTALTDTDGSETFTSGLLKGVPTGFTITGAAATKNADGTWSFDPTRASELKVTPPSSNYSGTVTITVEVNNKEVNFGGKEVDLTNNTNGNTDTFKLTFTPFADTPNLTVTDAVIKEDSTAAINAGNVGKRVNIQASLNDTDGSEQLTIAVAHVPAGITPIFPAGEAWVKDVYGTWVLTLPVGTTSYNGYIALPALAPNSDADYPDLDVRAYAREVANGSSAYNSEIASVIVDAVADQPLVSVSNVSGHEGDTMNLSLSAALRDTDGSETIVGAVLRGIPSGFTVTGADAVKNADGSWSIDPARLSEVKLTAPIGYNGSFTATLTVYNKETNLSGGETDLTDNTNSNTGSFLVTVSTIPFNPPVVDIDIIPGTDGANAYVYEDTTATNNALNSYSRVNFTADLDKTDGSEQLTVKVTIPAGFTPVFPAGEAWVQSGNVWTLTLPAGQNYSGYVALGSGAANADIDISGIKIDATSTQVATGRTLSDSDTAKVVVDAVADKPTLDAQDVTANEGSTAVALKITTALTDTDGSETFTSGLLKGVPTGFTITGAGATKNADGTWSFDPTRASELKVTPPSSNYSGTVTITVEVNNKEVNFGGKEVDLTNNTNGNTDTFKLTFVGKPDTPTLEVYEVAGLTGVNAVIKEDSTTPFNAGKTETRVNFKASLTDTDGSEVLVVKVTGLPSGQTPVFPAGEAWVNNAGVWTLTLPAGVTTYTGYVALHPLAANGDTDISGIKIEAVSVENGQTATSGIKTALVVVDAVADAPVVNANDVSGNEGSAIPLNISLALRDTDGSEVFTSALLKGVPTGFTITGAGAVKNADGTWSFDPARVGELKMTAPANYSGTVNITVVANNQETNLSGREVDLTDNTNTGSDSFKVTFAPVADKPILTVTDAVIKEDSSANVNSREAGKRVNIQAALTDTDGSEQLTVTIANIPNGVTPLFPAGEAWVKDASGVWVLALPVGVTSYNGYVALPSTGMNKDSDYADLVVKAYAREVGNGDTSIVSDTASVVVDAVADQPLLSVANASGFENTPLNLSYITADLRDLDGSEVLTSFVLKGIPAGFILTGRGAVHNADGSWSIDPNDRGTLTLTPPAGYNGQFTVTAVVNNKEVNLSGKEVDYTDNTNSNTGQFIVTFTPESSAPVLNVTDAVIKEDSAAAANATVGTKRVNIDARLTDTDEQLTIKVTGVPAGLTPVFPVGETWTKVGSDWVHVVTKGQNYTGYFALSALGANSDADITGIRVYATSAEAGAPSGATVSEAAVVTVDAVADGVDINLTGTHATAGTPMNLGITLSLFDKDGSEIVQNTVTLKGIPADYSLSAGTKQANGDWVVSKTDIANLKLITPATTTDKTFTVTVVAGSHETATGATEPDLTDNDKTNTEQFVIKVTSVPFNPPVVTVDTFGSTGANAVIKEDSTAASNATATSTRVNFTANLDKTDGSEQLTVKVTVPTGFVPVFPAGEAWTQVGNVWTLTLAAGKSYVGYVALSSGAGNADADISGIKIDATSTQVATGRVLSDSENASIIVDAVADKPTVTANDVTGKEDAPVALNINLALKDTDGSESFTSALLKGVPTGFTVTGAGATKNADGTWSFDPARVGELKLAAPANYSGTVSLTVVANNKETSLSGKETDTSDNTNSGSDTFTVTFAPVADKPTLTVSDAVIKEDSSAATNASATGKRINIDAKLTDASEQLTIKVSGVPSGVTPVFPAGETWTKVGSDWVHTVPVGQNYTGYFALGVLAANSDIDITGLKVTATSSEGGSSASTTDNAVVYVDAVADTPIANATNVSGKQGSSIALNLTAGLKDTDGSETITSILLKGVPSTMHLTAGALQADGSWLLTPAELAGLKLVTVAGFAGALNLTLVVNNKETNLSGSEVDLSDNTASSSSKFTVTVTPLEGPSAKDDLIRFTTCDSMAAGNVITGLHNTNTDGVDKPGDSANLRILSVKSNLTGETFTFEDTNDAAHVIGKWSSLFMFGNGTYMFYQDRDTTTVAHDESYTYTLVDGNGKTSTATIAFDGQVATNVYSSYTVMGHGALNGDSDSNLVYQHQMYGASNDVLHGGGGNDLILAYDGNDTLYGDAGNDVLLGQRGVDTLYGGTGADIFVASEGDYNNGQYDTIKDFSKADGDTLDLRYVLYESNVTDTAISSFVRSVDSGNGSFIQVNLDGAGSDWKSVLYLDGVKGLDVVQLHKDGQLEV